MNAASKPSILMVDDEPNVLSGFRRMLSVRYDVTTAVGGVAAMGLLQAKRRFPVIVTDMRMPEMDGVQFLQAVRGVDPDAVCIMLTGNADQETAVRAVNDGAIFRFLNKPCSSELLERAIQAALRQHELVTAERVLLRETLSGSLRLLVEALSLHDPRGALVMKSIRATVSELTTELGVADDWRYGLAGTLCLVGSVAMTHSDDVLEWPEARLMECASKGAKLLRHVPRLEDVAAMIEQQRIASGPYPAGDAATVRIAIGSRLLRAGFDFERAMKQTQGERAAALHAMRTGPTSYDPRVLDAIERLNKRMIRASVPTTGVEKVSIAVNCLEPGMVAVQDVVSSDGKLMLAQGYQLTEVVIDKLQALAQIGMIPTAMFVIPIAKTPPESGAVAA